MHRLEDFFFSPFRPAQGSVTAVCTRKRPNLVVFSCKIKGLKQDSSVSFLFSSLSVRKTKQKLLSQRCAGWKNSHLCFTALWVEIGCENEARPR